MHLAILTNEHATVALVFAGPTQDEAMAAAEAHARAEWAEWSEETDDAAWERYSSGDEGECPWAWMPAQMATEE